MMISSRIWSYGKRYIQPSVIRCPTTTTILRPVRQQVRSMATIQTTTDVQTAAYHFKQQKHLPYVLEYLMWVVFGSECLHLIWLKSEYKEYKEHSQQKIALFKELLHLLESGSPVPESLREEIKMLMLDEKFNKNLHQDIEDDYVEKCKEHQR
ncbi:uncharacterized protein BX664DRAFT_342636 [Halteromyces radiatus]|uniref:uncharacterized protein n=1 Tax=Halteromyces radiatus TaxID=101107 RepID=UPI00221F98E9|nr:uncharacterized protein BX664DRAFT_342636 [Halteromyces radiatus]KAI8078764.1 hypothetical protein BX664DRAFT_342636 [Halteromyces radiatus]